MIGRLPEVVRALISALDDHSKTIRPGAEEVTVRTFDAPRKTLGTAPLDEWPYGLLFTGFGGDAAPGPFPTSAQVVLSGRVKIGGAVPNKPMPSSLRVEVDYPKARNGWLTGGLVGTSGQVAADGTWELSVSLFFVAENWDRLIGVVSLDPTTAPVEDETYLIQHATWNLFMTVLSEAENSLGDKRDRLKFVARVRKQFAWPGDDGRASIDLMFGRYDTEPALYPSESRESSALWSVAFDPGLLVDGTMVEVGRVVRGILGGRTQRPVMMLPPVLRSGWGTFEPLIGDMATWSGTIGYALMEFLFGQYLPAQYDKWSLPGPWPSVDKYLEQLATPHRLTSDIDGMIMADRYDKTRSLADNLQTYYGNDSRKRFSTYLKVQKDVLGHRALALDPGAGQPHLTQASRNALAVSISASARLLIEVTLYRKGALTTTTPVGGGPARVVLPAKIDAALVQNSPEIEEAVDWFVDFLEEGLRQEQPQ